MSAWTDFRDSVTGEVQKAAASVGFGSAAESGTTIAQNAPSFLKSLFGPSANTQGNVSAAASNIMPPIITESVEKYKMYLIIGGGALAIYFIMKGRK